jgi:hypothetical protein
LLAKDPDPLTTIAIVTHESRWKLDAVSKDGQDFGLGQIEVRFLAPCFHPTSLLCHALRRRLTTDRAFSLKTTIAIESTWRKACRTTATAVWLAGYAGGKCGPTIPRLRAVLEILAIRERLRLRLSPLLPTSN